MMVGGGGEEVGGGGGRVCVECFNFSRLMI